MTSGKLVPRAITIALAAIVLLVGWQLGSRWETAEPVISEGVATPANQLASQLQVGTDFAEVAAQQERIILAQNDAALTSDQFQLGAHYDRLSPVQPTSSNPDQIEVAEIFWYGCPHCYTFDPYLESWKKNLPGNVNFVRIPAVWNPLLQLHARAFYTAEALGKSEEMHVPIFREIHINRNFLDTEQSLQTFFEQFDVNSEEFSNAFNSFSVHTKLQRANELSRRYRISSVPTVIVNGKYSTSSTKAGGYETLMDLIDELIASEAAGN